VLEFEGEITLALRPPFSDLAVPTMTPAFRFTTGGEGADISGYEKSTSISDACANINYDKGAS
jgi:hypothetical protein